MKNYRRISDKDREELVVYLERGDSQGTIGKKMGFSQSGLKLNDSTWHVIQNHLAIHWSPYQIADFLHKSVNDATVVPVSEKTIYNYLHFHMKGEPKKLALQELRPKGKKRTFVIRIHPRKREPVKIRISYSVICSKARQISESSQRDIYPE